MSDDKATVTSVTDSRPVMLTARGQPYEPAVGPNLRVLLLGIFAGVAFLGATGIYLGAIHLLAFLRGQIFETPFSLSVMFAHIAVGILFVAPFLYFGVSHLLTARHRPNRVAVRLGILLFATSLVVIVSGLLLVQLAGFPQLTTNTSGRLLVYWLHVAAPIFAVGVYVAHRRAGPAIQWKWGIHFGVAVGGCVAFMLVMHSQDPRQFAKGSPEGKKYFGPSKALTADAKFIDAGIMMMDEYCMRCHEDIYKSHLHSSHRFSSFNNPPYLFSVRETRRRMGVRASRWCAGCHDPVPFFSGAFDRTDFDDVNDPTAHAGITCTVCHSITHINSREGNAAYTIEEPQHYPFATSNNPVLQWINNQLVKAKPELHKKTFLKPFHRTEEFCSVCHKVGIPQEVNQYKEFLRGQDHSNSFWLSGVSGISARSFYYPAKAKTRCAECHMPLVPSTDFGARDFDGSGARKIHNHMFLGANTGIHPLIKHQYTKEAIAAHTKFLQGGPDGQSPPLRIDLFGLKHLTKEKQGVEAPLVDDKPLRPNLPRLQAGQSYLVEVVIRTLNIGHEFTQGTADSNEVWVDFAARSGKRILGRSGGMDQGEDQGRVDENAHFINVLMLDRHGNRIDRRNPQDIFTPLYNHQIPPGAAQVVHYRLNVPNDVTGAVELTARVRYRKFDYTYMEIVQGKGKVSQLPIVDLCTDKVVLPVAGVADKVPAQQSPIQPAWQRWNDYGIACFLEGGADNKKGELGMAETAFRRLLGAEFKDAPEAQSHGYLNLARVHLAYGSERLEEARQALINARKCNPPAPWWTVAWFNGLVDFQHVNFDDAIAQFEKILDPANRDPVRQFDFTKDYVVINELGKTLFARAQQEEGSDQKARDAYLRKAIGQFEKTLQFDPENVVAHDFLFKCFDRLGGGGDKPGLPDNLAAEEKRLLQGVLLWTAKDPERMRAARGLADLLRDIEPRSSALRVPVLARAYEETTQAAVKAPLVWDRLAAASLLTRLDRWLLSAVPERAAVMHQSGEPSARRLQAGEELYLALVQLGNRPPPAEVLPPLLALNSWPRPGLPANLALTGLADKGHLQGPLPAPRLLALQAARSKVRGLWETGQGPEIEALAARVLARMHLLQHGIFKPDDNAAGSAVQRYQARHPAAARARQPIVIYPLQTP